MNYAPPYRIEHSKAYKLMDDEKAYLFMGTKLSLGKEEWQKIQQEIAIYEANYDKANKSSGE